MCDCWAILIYIEATLISDTTSPKREDYSNEAWSITSHEVFHDITPSIYEQDIRINSLY